MVVVYASRLQFVLHDDGLSCLQIGLDLVATFAKLVHKFVMMVL